jgi:hypothetical protein
MFGRKRVPPTPTELDSHARVLQKQLGAEAVFVFDTLPAYDRNRLLKRRIPFIVPHRQMFLPGGMLDLRETHGAPPRPQAQAGLSMPAQLLLLHHLQKRPNQDTPFALYEWAEALQYSRMSITRAHRELLDAGLVNPGPPVKSVMVIFNGDKRNLWDRALPQLRSPVLREGHYRLKRNPLPSMLDAGLTALAHYTDLAEGPQRTLAAWRRMLPGPAEAEPAPHREEDTVLLQHWWYPPMILSGDDRTVDRLSLYLSLRETADERVASALEQLLEGVKW